MTLTGGSPEHMLGPGCSVAVVDRPYPQEIWFSSFIAGLSRANLLEELWVGSHCEGFGAGGLLY